MNRTATLQMEFCFLPAGSTELQPVHPPVPAEYRPIQDSQRVTLLDIERECGHCPKTGCERALYRVRAYTAHIGVIQQFDDILAGALERMLEAAQRPGKLDRWKEIQSAPGIFQWFVVKEVFRRFPALESKIPPSFALGYPISKADEPKLFA